MSSINYSKISFQHIFLLILCKKIIRQFLDVGLDDKGNYSCIANNEFGEQEKTVQLIITGLGKSFSKMKR